MPKVDFTDERIEAHLSFHRATLGDGVKRSILLARVSDETFASSIDAYTRGKLALDLLCALDASSTLTIDGAEIDLQALSINDFVNLPELPGELLGLWYEAVYSSNPRWSSAPADPKGSETIPTASTSG
jgi:hypothetical protein